MMEFYGTLTESNPVFELVSGEDWIGCCRRAAVRAAAVNYGDFRSLDDLFGDALAISCDEEELLSTVKNRNIYEKKGTTLKVQAKQLTDCLTNLLKNTHPNGRYKAGDSRCDVTIKTFSDLSDSEKEMYYDVEDKHQPPLVGLEHFLRATEKNRDYWEAIEVQLNKFEPAVKKMLIEILNNATSTQLTHKDEQRYGARFNFKPRQVAEQWTILLGLIANYSPLYKKERDILSEYNEEEQAIIADCKDACAYSDCHRLSGYQANKIAMKYGYTDNDIMDLWLEYRRETE